MYSPTLASPANLQWSPCSSRPLPYSDVSSPRRLSVLDRDSYVKGISTDGEPSQEVPRSCLTRICASLQSRFNTLTSNASKFLRIKSGEKNLASLPLDGKPQISAFRDHIAQGLQLIREGHYEEAIQHFHNQKAAQGIGYKLENNAADLFVREIPTRQDDIDQLVNQYAPLSMSFSETKWIKLARINFIAGALYDELKPQTPDEEKALRQIRQEEALIHAEEHIHALQQVLGRNITFLTPNVPDDYEIDIATTLAAEKVPMTDAFLKRYGRSKYVEPQSRQ